MTRDSLVLTVVIVASSVALLLPHLWVRELTMPLPDLPSMSAGCKAELRPSGMYSLVEIFGVKIVRRVKWPGNHPKEEYWVFCNPDDVELKKVWKEDGGKQEELPAIDHSKESLVVFF